MSPALFTDKEESLVKGGVKISRININDGTVEGLRSDDHQIFSIQYHAEASPGPMDSVNLFGEFVEMVKGYKG